MRSLTFLFLGLFLLTCQSNADGEDAEKITGNVMEIAPSQEELDEIALLEQPEIVQSFFAIEDELFGTDFCYDYNSISQLILYGNDSSEEWSNFALNDNYLTIYHNECGVFLEFMTFEIGEGKKAFLSQMNRGSQQFNYLRWNESRETWRNSENYPKPNMDEYYSDLSSDEQVLVNEYGVDFIYLNPQDESATYLFSDWAMRMNMGEKELLDFEHDIAYEFELSTESDRFSLNPVELKTNRGELFFVAYSKTAEPTETFQKKYVEIYTALSEEALDHQLIHYGANNFKVFFQKDTFDFSSMEQFEPRDGFWFYMKGESPLDLGSDEESGAIIQQARTYFQNNPAL